MHAQLQLPVADEESKDDDGDDRGGEGDGGVGHSNSPVI